MRPVARPSVLVFLGGLDAADMRIKNAGCYPWGRKVKSKARIIPYGMKTIHKSVLIWYSPAQMCDLVADVGKYPDFLPWCNSAQALAPEADGGYIAEVGMRFASINQAFATRNRVDYPHSLRMDLVRGPFSSLQGHWQFLCIDGEPQACRVVLDLSYSFNALLSAVVGPVFDKIASTMVDSFIQRAEQVYG